MPICVFATMINLCGISVRSKSSHPKFNKTLSLCVTTRKYDCVNALTIFLFLFLFVFFFSFARPTLVGIVNAFRVNLHEFQTKLSMLCWWRIDIYQI